MGWPYQFVALDADGKQARRHSIDRHAAYAQLSAFLPVCLFLLYRLAAWLVRKTLSSDRVAYSAVPDSPGLKKQRHTLSGYCATWLRRVSWWLGDDVLFLGQNWGRRDQLIAGVGWTVWLLFLCVVNTGSDYLHLTKRLGLVAISQFPVQYLLALKNLNPFALAFQSSHEQVNRWHRVLGRIIYLLLFMHTCLYLNYYVQQGILSQKLVSLVPALGISAFTGMCLLGATSLRAVREYSYRVFFITHLIVALSLPPIIYFHAHHSTPYVVGALVVFFADIVKHKLDTVTAETTIEAMPGTDLIKIVANIPSDKAARFREKPGSHVYIKVPHASRPSSNPASLANMVFEFTFNPFTIAAVDEDSGALTLVARQHSGPMTRNLVRLSNASSANLKVPLSIEGPYGCTAHFLNRARTDFDRILLVAGGVGSTFIMPLYRAILSDNPAAKVQMIWAVRTPGDATWPVDGDKNNILDDDNIQIYLTGKMLNARNDDTTSTIEDEEIEMNRLSQDARRNKYNQIYDNKRPNFRNIVDKVFRQSIEDRVAVVVCGPVEMSRDLRACVGVWVKKGRSVWWHNESFAW
ncbi:ferric reductase like transmembrane component [Biscogniauxia mediterranea]|nr:ferric reductase like transmembrane component [Biscogniauxia mediterranea]